MLAPLLVVAGPGLEVDQATAAPVTGLPDTVTAALTASMATANTVSLAPAPEWRPFSDSSAFNTPIHENVQVDPRNAEMVQVLAGRGYATTQVYADTPPVYYATSSTPRYSMTCTKDWGVCDLERMSVPIPDGAVTSTGYDRNMVVVDRAAEKVYEFWQYDPNRRSASWGAVLPLNGSGTGSAESDPGRYGATGAGVSRLAGLIRPDELAQGRINHALVGPTGYSCKATYRYPAVKSDGWSTASNCIPEGARVQLDPSVNCTALPGIEHWEITVCRALKEYGWYNIDNGNVGVEGFGIQFENPAGETDVYRNMGIEEYQSLRAFPLEKLRVLSDEPTQPESPDPSDQPTQPESPDPSDQPTQPESPDPSTVVTATGPGSVAPGPRWRPFNKRSAFNKSIGKRVRVARRSRAMVKVLAGRGYATTQVYADTPPVYYATSSTPRYSMTCTKDWGVCDLERMSVPIPDGAVTSTGYDRNMVVVDRAAEKVYEFWQYDPNRRSASWGAVLPLNGSGTGSAESDPGRYGATGAGVSRLAGLIRPDELAQGRINHALVGPTGYSCKATYRYPAVKSDGWSTASNCIPEGARVQLDPSVNCTALPGIEQWEITVCRALKEYGWYNIDNGNVGVEGFGIQFENPAGETDVYRNMGIKEYMPIRDIPLGKLRVLKRWNSFG